MSYVRTFTNLFSDSPFLSVDFEKIEMVRQDEAGAVTVHFVSGQFLKIENGKDTKPFLQVFAEYVIDAQQRERMGGAL